MSTSDRRVLEAPIWRRRFDEDFREALKPGPGAAVQDLALGSGPPDVDPADLAVGSLERPELILEWVRRT